jgi:hypothetical protein
MTDRFRESGYGHRQGDRPESGGAYGGTTAIHSTPGLGGPEPPGRRRTNLRGAMAAGLGCARTVVTGFGRVALIDGG